MDKNEHLEDLAHIRSLMEKSTRFISLSGLSGVGAGVAALLGAGIIYVSSGMRFSGYHHVRSEYMGYSYLYFEVAVALGVLALALLSGYIFTARRAKRKGQNLFNKSSMRLIRNLFIPLGVGGLFCIILMYHSYWELVGPCTLLFYGLALINASKYTLEDIRHLGIAQTVLGLISTFFLQYTLLFWALGFGVMHIIYGLVMFYKYER